MDVDRSNLAAVLPLVRRAIAECDFAAFDFEMTGLSTSAAQSFNGVDSLQERYLKVRDAGANIAAVQFGLCLFKWREPVSAQPIGLEAKPFNFWVYPRTWDNQREGDSRLVFQTGSIEFLASCGFDFNRSLRAGVSYVDLATARGLEDRFQQRLDERSSRGDGEPAGGIDLSTVRDFAARALSEALAAAATLHEAPRERQGEAAGPAAAPEAVPAAAQATAQAQALVQVNPFGERYVVLPPCNGFIRRLIYQELPKSFPRVHVAKLPEDNGERRFGGEFRLRLTLCPEGVAPADLTRRGAQDEMARERRELEEAVGLGRVIEALVAAKKPLVGHNCLLDLGHFAHKFIAPMPEQLEEWRAQLHAALPVIVDTKHLFQTEPQLKGWVPLNSLAQCFQGSQQGQFWHSTNPVLALEPEFARYAPAGDGAELHHEAGYDALMTGVVYARALCKLGMPGLLLASDAPSLKFPHLVPAPQPPALTGAFGAPLAPEQREQQLQQEPQGPPPAPALAAFEQRRHLFNVLYLMRSDAVLDLARPNREPSRATLVRLCNFPESAKTFDLQRVVGQAVGARDVRIIWDTDHAAFCWLQDARAVESLLLTYLQYRSQADAGRIRAPQGRFTMQDLDIVPFEMWRLKGGDDARDWVSVANELLPPVAAGRGAKRARDDDSGSAAAGDDAAAHASKKPRRACLIM